MTQFHVNASATDRWNPFFELQLRSIPIMPIVNIRLYITFRSGL